MKKLSCLTLLGASLLMFSCGDDAPSADPYAVPEKFSSKTVEQNKAQLEDNGVKLLKSLEGLRDAKAIKTAANLSQLLELLNAGEEESIPGGRIIRSLGNLRTNSKSAVNMFSAMRLKGDVPNEEPESPKHFFEVYSGTYTYLAATEEWDFVAGGSSLILKFPAVEGGTQNNATLTVRDYQGKDVTIDDYTGDLPTNLAMDLVVDGSKIMEYSFKATYNGSDDPTSLATSLTLAPYVFNVNFSNTTTSVEANYSLKNGSETLIALGGSSTGKYSVEAIENAEDDLVKNASAYFQVYNIKIAGNVNVENIQTGMDVIYPQDYWNNPNFDDKAATEEKAALYNENYKLVAFYADSNEKIADTEFYTESETYSDYDYYDRDNDGDYEEMVEYTDTDMDVRFIFADGSKADYETYFETGFAEIEAEFKNFIEAFEE